MTCLDASNPGYNSVSQEGGEKNSTCASLVVMFSSRKMHWYFKPAHTGVFILRHIVFAVFSLEQLFLLQRQAQPKYLLKHCMTIVCISMPHPSFQRKLEFQPLALYED